MQRRRFRDVFFLLLYAAFWAGMVYIAVIAYKQGIQKLPKFAEVPRSCWCVGRSWCSHEVDSIHKQERASCCTGHPARLSYGIDSAGNTCGQKNYWNGGQGPDLTDYKKLYYLNPLELLDTDIFLGARSVCLKDCPGAESACGLTDFPCRANTQYRYVFTGCLNQSSC